MLAANQISICKNLKNLNTDIILFTNLTKWIIDLNVSCKAVKILQDYKGENLGDLGFGDDFLDTTLKAWSVKEKKL